MSELPKYGKLLLTILEALNQRYDAEYSIYGVFHYVKNKLLKQYSLPYLKRQLKQLCDSGAVIMKRHYQFPSTYKITDFGITTLAGLKELNGE